MRTSPTAAVIAVLTLTIIGQAEAEERENVDFYIQVDVGQKYYDIELNRTGNQHLHGRFDDSIVITPTLCLRKMDHDLNFGVVGTFGLAYGHYSSEFIEADTLEIHLGFGGTARMADWANLNVMGKLGLGWSGIELPEGYRTWDNRTYASGASYHAEVVATYGVNLWGALITANAGYRVTYMEMGDSEYDHHSDDYLIHGFVVGGGVGFTF